MIINDYLSVYVSIYVHSWNLCHQWMLSNYWMIWYYHLTSVASSFVEGLLLQSLDADFCECFNILFFLVLVCSLSLHWVSSCLLESVLRCCCFLPTEFDGLCSTCHPHVAPLWRVWRWSFWYCVLLRQAKVNDDCAYLYISFLRISPFCAWFLSVFNRSGLFGLTILICLPGNHSRWTSRAIFEELLEQRRGNNQWLYTLQKKCM